MLKLANAAGTRVIPKSLELLSFNLAILRFRHHLGYLSDTSPSVPYAVHSGNVALWGGRRFQPDEDTYAPCDEDKLHDKADWESEAQRWLM
jgi:hypothetical protein